MTPLAQDMAAEVTAQPQNSPTPPASNIRSVRDIFSALTSAYQIKESGDRLLNPCLLGVFVLANLGLYELFLQLPVFQEVALQVRAICSVAFALITFLLPFFLIENTFNSAIKDLQERSFSINVCKSLAVIVGLAYLAYAIAFDSKLILNYSIHNSLMSLIAILAVGDYLEAKLFQRIRQGLGFDLRDLAPTAQVLQVPAVVSEGASEQEAASVIRNLIPTNQLKIGDIVELRDGETVQCDGTVVSGTCQLLETRLSARGKMRYKQKGDQIYSGSSITHGSLQYRVTALADDSFISSFSTILNDRIVQEADSQLDQHNYKQLIVSVICIGLAAGVAFFWSARGQTFGYISSAVVSLLLIGLAAKYIQLNFFLKAIVETTAFLQGALAPKRSLSDALGGIKTLILDYSAQSSIGVEKMQSLELIDKRIEIASLTSVLLSLAGRGNSAQSMAINNYILENFKDSKLSESSEFAEHEGRGFYGKVSGFDFTIGNEDFLLDRGVMAQISEINSADSDAYYWYVALQDEVIASIKFVKAFSLDIKHALTRLHAYQVRTLLCSMEPSAQVDELGKKIGLELADVYGGLTLDNYGRKAESLSPFALHNSIATPKEIVSKAAVTLSRFDDLRWDISQSDILLFSPDPSLLGEIFALSAELKLVAQQNFWATTALSVLLLVLSCFALVSPVVVAFAVTTASLAMLMNVLRLQG